MKTTVTLSSFRDSFQRAGRGTQFSYDGLEVLFEYFEQLEEDIGEEIELDVIGICCEYAEASPLEIADNYSIDIEGLDDESDIEDKVRDYLQDEGVYVGTTDDNNIVYRQF
jgi:hypothetical protein